MDMQSTGRRWITVMRDVPIKEARDLYANGQTTTELANRYGVSPNTIWVRLRQHGVPMRPPGPPSHTVVLSPEAKEFLAGELLGDGCLYTRSRPGVRYKHTSKYQQYIQWLERTLVGFGIETGRTHSRSFGGREAYFYESLSYRGDLAAMYERWYPERKKRIPEDLVLTPLVCRQWYIGDGGLLPAWGKDQYARFATCCFTVDEVVFLADKLKDLGFDARIQRDRSYLLIRLTVQSTRDFLKYIGHCPIACYAYKWRLAGVQR